MKTDSGISATTTFLILLLAFNNVFAQNKFSAGPVTGFGVSSIRGNENSDVKLHGHIGALANIRLNENLNFQPTLILTNKGYRGSDVKLNLTYIDCILNLKIHPGEIFFLGAGLQTGFLINNKYRYLAYGTDYYDTVDIDDALHNFDYGINTNFGFQFNNGIGLEMAFLFGLKDVLNSKGTQQFYGEKYEYPTSISNNAFGKNTVIATSFYYLIGNKK